MPLDGQILNGFVWSGDHNAWVVARLDGTPLPDTGGGGGGGSGDDLDTTPVAAVGSSVEQPLPNWLAGAPILEIPGDTLTPAGDHRGIWVYLLNDIGTAIYLPDDWLPGWAFGARQIGEGMVTWEVIGSSTMQMPFTKIDHNHILEQYEEVVFRVISNGGGHAAVWAVSGSDRLMFLPASLGNILPRADLPSIEESLWYPSTNPPAETVVADPPPGGQGVNLGVLFTVGVNGVIRSVCYYRWSALQNPNGSVAIWQVDHGQEVLLGRANFTGHSGVGWKRVDFATPIKCEGKFCYKASVWLPISADGFVHYTSTHFFYQTKSTYSEHDFIVAWLADGRPDPRGFVHQNGFYKYGGFAIPTEDFYQSNYWVDVVVYGPPKPDPPLPPLNLKWPIPLGYPTFDNTGIPVGSVLTTYRGDYPSTADGQIIELLDVTDGAIQVRHNNVTVRKCRVRYPGNNLITVEFANTGVIIEDCELDGTGRHNHPCNGIAGAPMIIRRCNIYRVENGFYSYGYSDQVGTTVVIEDNFIHNLISGPGGPPHYDGLQYDGGQGNTIIKHNTVFVEHSDTSCIMLDNEFGRLFDFQIEDNFVGGAGYPFYCVTQTATPGSNPITNVNYINNQMHLGYWGYFTTREEAEIEFHGNQHLDHGGVFDQPPLGGFANGQSVPESFFGFRFNVEAGINGDTVDAATGGITIGLAFTVTKSGLFTGLNYVRPNQFSTTTYKVGIWRLTGDNRLGGTVPLGSETFTNVNRPAPQMLNFTLTAPISVMAGDNLLVGLFIPRGPDGNCWYMVSVGAFWPNPVPSQWGSMIAFSNNSATITNGFHNCNGMYAYGPDLQPPTNITNNDSNYWIDPVVVAPWVSSALTVTGAQTTLKATQIGTMSLDVVTRVVAGAQTTSAITQTSALVLGPGPRTVTGAQTMVGILQSSAIVLVVTSRFVTGAQTTSAVTQSGTIAVPRAVTGAQTTLKTTQSGTIAVPRTVTGTQVTFTATQTSAIVTIPTGFPDSTNTGHTKAPGYPGSLSAPPGTITSGSTYSFRDFIDEGDIPAGVTNVTFIGCRFQSNARGDDSGAFTWPYSVLINGGNVTYSYCTFCPKISIVTAPPNAAWPSAGAGQTVWGFGGGYASYCIGANQGYQFAIACHGGGAVVIDHCDIWGFGNAIDCNPDSTGSITMTNTWMHDGANSDPTGLRASGYHTDGPGYLDGGSAPKNIAIRNCTIASLGNTNAIAFQAATTPYQNIEVDGCYLSGFGVTVDMCHNVVGSTNIKFTNNTISTAIRWGFRPFREDWTARFNATSPTNQWFNNTFLVWPGTSASPDSDVTFTSGDDGKFCLPTGGLVLSTTDWVDGHP